MRTFIFGCCVLICVACGGRANGEKMSPDAQYDSAWQAVTSAQTAESQRAAIDAFIALNESSDGAPPRQVSVTASASGQKAPIDNALWANPQQYEVTLRYGERSYVFVPKSRLSLEPLFRE